MRKTSLPAFVFVGLVSTIAAFSPSELATRFLSELQQGKPENNGVHNVLYTYKTGLAGNFFIGSQNNTLNLRPAIDMDFSLIAAHNCSQCPYNRYDSKKSQE